jgi:hypothetical protein
MSETDNNNNNQTNKSNGNAARAKEILTQAKELLATATETFAKAKQLLCSGEEKLVAIADVVGRIKLMRVSEAAHDNPTVYKLHAYYNQYRNDLEDGLLATKAHKFRFDQPVTVLVDVNKVKEQPERGMEIVQGGCMDRDMLVDKVFKCPDDLISRSLLAINNALIRDTNDKQLLVAFMEDSETIVGLFDSAYRIRNLIAFVAL